MLMNILDGAAVLICIVVIFGCVLYGGALLAKAIGDLFDRK